jgi:purine-binding chemotaxis protein CheW
MIRQYATFEVDGKTFGIDVARVQEVFRHHDRTPVPLADRSIAGLINLRGEVIAAVDLRSRLGFPALAGSEPVNTLAGSEPKNTLAGSEPMNVVVRTGEEAVSLLVDSIGDVTQADDAAVEPPPDTIGEPARSMIIGAVPQDGRILLLLDANRATDLTNKKPVTGDSLADEGNGE